MYRSVLHDYCISFKPVNADVAESADALGSGPSVPQRREGSTPFIRTMNRKGLTGRSVSLFCLYVTVRDIQIVLVVI